MVSKQFLCSLLNRAIPDDVFISAVYSSGKKNVKYFETAQTDTLIQCDKYISRIVELFPHLSEFVQVFIEGADKAIEEDASDFFNIDEN